MQLGGTLHEVGKACSTICREQGCQHNAVGECPCGVVLCGMVCSLGDVPHIAGGHGACGTLATQKLSSPALENWKAF